MPKLIALAIIPALWVALWADLAAAEIISACLRGNTGQIIKAQIGGKPTHPCIGWQKPIQIPLWSVEPSPQEQRRGLVLGMPVTTEVVAFVPDDPDFTHTDIAEVSGGTLSVNCVMGANRTVLQWWFWPFEAGGDMSVEGHPERSKINMPTADPSIIEVSQSDDGAQTAVRVVPEAYFRAADGSEIRLERGEAVLHGPDAVCVAKGRVTYQDAAP